MALTLQEAYDFYNTHQEAYDERLYNVEEMIRKRILSGVNADGNRIGNYSEKESKWGRWKDVRVKFGKQVEYVDFSFTGDLLNDLQVWTRGGVTRIEFSESKNIRKRSGLTAMFGNVFSFSEEEIAEVSKSYLWK